MEQNGAVTGGKILNQLFAFAEKAIIVRAFADPDLAYPENIPGLLCRFDKTESFLHVEFEECL